MDTYDSYNLYNFSVPVGIYGDSYDRYLIRVEEMRESTNIMYQCISFLQSEHFLGSFAYNADDLKVSSNSRSFMKKMMESLIHHFRIFSEGSLASFEYSSVIVEAPKGEFGVFLVSNGLNKPYRCRIKSPGFLHLQGLEYMTKNNLLADLVAIIGTQDLVFGEIDR